jgi:hypothetical protein
MYLNISNLFPKAMHYKLPTDEEVLQVILTIVRQQGIINSQQKLELLVRKELHKINPDYKITGHRIRMIAVNSDEIALEVYCRENGIEEPPEYCLVCGTKLRAIRNMTIYGWEITLGARCPKCPYWTSRKRRRPTRYVFSLRVR